MPHYEYYCKDCKQTFTTTEHINEHGKHEVKCPKCKSKNVEQQYAAFSAVTSRKT
jgi:putative FmdB family regulatory protein